MNNYEVRFIVHYKEWVDIQRYVRMAPEESVMTLFCCSTVSRADASNSR